ncbi:MAG: HD domain-containing protein [Lachnospiraceae bacterium]|nr:HD domain-containing protein [Lachnospiraceae bacterium]
MTPAQLLSILSQAAKLKTNTRHCYTEPGRKESVADHSWRLALMAMLLRGVPEYAELDMDRVIRMCLIHDLGESFTGDVPTFEKTGDHEKAEEQVYLDWVDGFPSPDREEWLALLREMKALETPEAKLYKALDKMEAVIAHDESDIATWLPLEYDLQLTYGRENVAFSPYMRELKETIDDWTRKKIREEGAS